MSTIAPRLCSQYRVSIFNTKKSRKALVMFDLKELLCAFGRNICLVFLTLHCSWSFFNRTFSSATSFASMQHLGGNSTTFVL